MNHKEIISELGDRVALDDRIMMQDKHDILHQCAEFIMCSRESIEEQTEFERLRKLLINLLK